VFGIDNVFVYNKVTGHLLGGCGGGCGFGVDLLYLSLSMSGRFYMLRSRRAHVCGIFLVLTI
jgi:hypothetical protein